MTAIASRKSIVGAVVVLIFCVPSVCLGGEVFDFSSSLITSLEAAHIQGEKTKNNPSKSMLAMMKNVMLLNGALASGHACLGPFKESKNDIIREASIAFCTAYAAIIENNNRALALMEKTLNERSDSFKEGTFTRNLSQVMAANEELWKIILDSTLLSSYALVDSGRTENGKLRFLTITSAERLTLIERLEDAFGPQIMGGPQAGQVPLVGSASILWAFLNKGWKTSDSN